MSRPGLRHALRRFDGLVVLALAPLLLFPSAGSAWTLLLYVVLLGLQWWAWGESLPLTPLNSAILLVLVMTGVSIFVTPDLAGSLGKISGVLLGVLVYFTVVRHAKTRPGWNRTLVLWSLAGIGVAAVGLVGTNWFTTKITALNVITSRLPVRLLGLQGAEAGIQPNEVAGALLWIVPVVFMAGVSLLVEPKWFASRSGRGKVLRGNLAAWWMLIIAAIALCGGVLVLSQSRGGYLALLIAGVMVVLLTATGKWRWAAVSILAIALIAGVVVTSQMGIRAVLDLAIDSLPVGASAFSLNSITGRVEIWSRAIAAIKDVPLTGLGMNVFRKAIHLIYPPFQIAPTFSLGHAHNELLQAALDLGIPGLVGFFALYVGSAGMLMRTMRGTIVWRLLGIGLLSGFLAHFLFGITDAVALGAKPGFLFWWLLGMVYGAYEQNQHVKVAHP